MTDDACAPDEKPLWPLLAYAGSLSVQAGEELALMVSSARPRFEASLVRLGMPGHPGLEQPVASAIDGSHPGRLQPLCPGSYVEAPALTGLLGGSYAFQGWIYPTLPGKGVQAIASQGAEGAAGWAFELDRDGRLRLREWSAGVEAIPVTSEVTLQAGCWHFVAVIVDASRAAARIAVAGASRWMEPGLSLTETAYASERQCDGEPARVRIAACRGHDGVARSVFNGKIEAPRLFAAALDQDQLERLRSGEAPERVVQRAGALIGAWGFSVGIDTLSVYDQSPSGAHGRCVNMPMRAATGHRWRGQALSPQEDPGLYGAIHFHDDDLVDADWSPDLSVTVSEGLDSGLYAAKLTSGEDHAYVPFYVRPKAEIAAPVLVVAPTNTYLAYANRRDVDLNERPVALDVPLRPVDEQLITHPGLGGSLYDLHSDGSGVCYSSRLRPILTIDPTYLDVLIDGPRHFAADVHLLAWLTAEGQSFDVVTDEDLHREGASLLRRYAVVITGSHPEYCSSAMLDAIEIYLQGGGSLMYLGGNGFYWVTSYHPELPHVIEVRKGFAGTRNWQVAPGEEHHSSTGERGGLWRHRGRSAHRLVGVGTTGHAAAKAVGYRRMPESYDSRVSFVFEGVGGERFGELGLALGGAAGDEVDAADSLLGTPAQAVVLARSEMLAGYAPMMEDELLYHPDRTGEHNPRIRSELVLWETRRGGAVFSVGSVSWCAALGVNDFDNDVSRITGNVMRDFLRRAAERQGAPDDAGQ